MNAASKQGGGRFGELAFLAKHSVIYGIGNMLSRIVAFVMLPIYTRHLTPFDYGVLELVDTTLAMVGLVAGLGVAGAMSRFYFEYSEPRARDRVVSTTFVLAGVAVALVLALLLPLSSTLAQLLFDRSGLASIFVVALIGLGIGLFIDVAQVYLRIRQQSLWYVAVSVANLVVGVGLNIYFVVFQETGVIGIFYASLGAKVVVGVPLAIAILARVGLQFDTALAKDMCRYSLPLIPSDLANTAVGYSDRYFINHFLSTADAGIYGLAQKIGTAVHLLVTSPFLMTYLPRRFEIAQGPDAPRVFASIFDYHVLVLLIMSVALAIYAHEILIVMTTAPYYGAAQLLPLIAFSMIVLGTKYHFQFGILYRKMTRYQMYINLGTAVLHVALNAVLIPQLGLWGGLVAFNLAMATNSALTYIVSRDLYPIPYDFARNLRLLAVGLVFYAAAIVFGHGTWMAVAWKAGMLLLLPFAIMSAGVVPKAELARIGELVRRLRAPAAG